MHATNKITRMINEDKVRVQPCARAHDADQEAPVTVENSRRRSGWLGNLVVMHRETIAARAKRAFLHLHTPYCFYKRKRDINGNRDSNRGRDDHARAVRPCRGAAFPGRARGLQPRHGAGFAADLDSVPPLECWSWAETDMEVSLPHDDARRDRGIRRDRRSRQAAHRSRSICPSRRLLSSTSLRMAPFTSPPAATRHDS